MSVPPEVLQQIMAGGDGAGAPAAGPPQAGAGVPALPPAGGGIGATSGQKPAAAPMSVPQEKKGLKAAAATNVHIAVNMLEEALPAFGSESTEGAKILAALKSLSSLVPKRDTSDLVPAEILQMVRRLPQMGGGTDVQKQIMRQMMGQNQPPTQAPGPRTLQ